jgi:hypothetical protein
MRTGAQHGCVEGLDQARSILSVKQLLVDERIWT